MEFALTRFQILNMWIELDKNYTAQLLLDKNYFNLSELNRQMFLTSLFCKQQQEMLLAMREVEQINTILPTLTSITDIEKTVSRRIVLSDLISFYTTPLENFPYSIEEIFLYVDKIELHQKMLNIPF
jgi:hypothetical protein